jgi:hypothetical protein
MQVKPVVDGIEQDVAGRALVLRVDLTTAPGARIGARFGVEFTPTFVLLDRRGVALDTLRSLDRRAVASRLIELAG